MCHKSSSYLITLPKTLILEPKNGALEDDVPFQGGDFQVPAVSFRRSNFNYTQRKNLKKPYPPSPPQSVDFCR